MNTSAKDLLVRSLNAVIGIGALVLIVMLLAAVARQGPLYDLLFG